MEFTERHLVEGIKLAMSVWLLPDGTTQAVKIADADYMAWRQVPGQPADQCPGKPVEGAKFLVASAGHYALDTVDGWPHTGDTWMEGDNRFYQVSEDLDWSYRTVVFQPITEDRALKITRNWCASGNRSLDPNSIPTYDHVADETEVDIHHSVTVISTAEGSSSGAAQIASCSIDLLSGANRAAAVGMSVADAVAISGEAVTVGGQSATQLVTYSFSGDSDFRAEIFGRITTLTGTQTAEATWTTNNYVGIGVIVCSGVDQSTPFNNPASTELGGAPFSLEVTSASGDLTMTVISDRSGLGPTGTDANQVWAFGHSSQIGCGGDYGDGAGTQTHTWTESGDHVTVIVGINFKQSTGGPTLEVEAFN